MKRILGIAIAVMMLVSCSSDDSGTNSDNGGNTNPSKSGILLLKVSDNSSYNIVKYDLNTGQSTLLTSDFGSGENGVENSSAQISDDGTTIVWSRYPHNVPYPGGYSVYRMTIDGGEKQPILPSGHIAQSGALDENGRCMSTSVGHDTLMIVDLNGSVKALVNTDSDQKYDASISPDGSHVAYLVEVTPTPSVCDLYVSKTDGSGKQKVPATHLSRDYHAFTMEWSPQGDKLGYTDLESSSLKLKVYNVASASVSTLAADVGYAHVNHGSGGIAWAADGSRLYYVNAGDSCLYSIPSVGGSPQRVSQVKAVRPRVSSDGKVIAFGTHVVPNFEHWIATVKPDGSSLDSVYVDDGSGTPRGLSLMWLY